MGSTTSVLTLCLATVCSNPVEKVAVDRVDLIEINHFFDEQGRLVFDQIIFYEWSPSDSRYNVRDWRLLKSPAQVPLRNWRNNDYVAIWHDFKDRDVLRKVHARMLRETWTQYDPELVEREFLSQERRRELHRRVSGLTLEETDVALKRYARRTSSPNAVRR